MTSSIATEPAPGGPVNTSRPPAELKVTQLRVLHSEWVKFRSLRSTTLSVSATIVGMIGLGWVFAAVDANRWPVMRAGAKARFDPTAVSLEGFFVAQLVVGVLGALIVSGEYGTGMIRASLSAAPTRLPVLWAKAIVFAAVTFVVTTVSAFIAFLGGQAFLSSQHIETTLGAPGVLRAVVGTGLYLTVVGLLGVAFGWIVRHTAGAIAALFGLLLVLPALGDALPDSWAPHINPYLPGNAGQQVLMVRHEAGMLSPWAGFAVFCGYLVVGIVAAAILLKRRDA
ncbi:ABC transporter permease subunit [Amycolatopsis sp. H20-H5]|uniref:ABC transporter permease subunit n=1 Tax=Amycolatopsis sp. H20-H5 TaxID=3046309 RepID=UPI002DBEC0CF|nr:ABC transporter permease subunit [Amycolatopsis sp. H20-H5]MEC3981655.1 ABC transporter permease subunit [Amycolatopsis sp. H20-H5]